MALSARSEAALPTIPAADSLPPNAVVLSLSGTQRTALTWGFVGWSATLFFGGIALGWWMARR